MPNIADMMPNVVRLRDLLPLEMKSIPEYASGPLFEKTVSNMHEVWARRGKVMLISDYDGIEAAGAVCFATITMPKVHPLIAPLVNSVPIQLLAYHTALAGRADVDQPRHLAKSVAVEQRQRPGQDDIRAMQLPTHDSNSPPARRPGQYLMCLATRFRFLGESEMPGSVAGSITQV